jgi:putative addiction module component (TIGR02574 family)
MTKLAELKKLPISKKLEIIDELWASIPEKDIPIEPGQVAEARKRLEELKANPAMGLSYAQLKARLG